MGISASAAIAAISDAVAAAGATTAAAGSGIAAGLGGGTLASALGAGATGALDLGATGALLGAGEGLVTGQAPFKTGLQGLEAGAAAGFGGGIGDVLGGAAGIGAGVGAGLGGAAFGAGESALSGGNPLTGAFTGAIGGYGASSLPGVGGGTIGTAAPSGASSAAGGSLSAAGGQVPTEALGSDLTSATAPLGAPVSSAPLSNIASGGSSGAGGIGGGGGGNPLSGVIGGNSANLVSPDFSTGENFGSAAQNAAATASFPSGSSTPTPAAGAASPGFGTDIANFFGASPGAGSFLDKNGGMLLQGALTGASSLEQNAQLKKLLQPLQSAATSQNATDATLQAPLLTGAALPAGDQAAVNQQAASQKAQVRSTYASLGLSGSTMEAEALAQVDQQTAVTTGNFANTLFQEGQTGSAMSNGLNQTILSTTLAQDKALQDAINNFASQALGTQQPKATTININGAPAQAA